MRSCKALAIFGLSIVRALDPALDPEDLLTPEQFQQLHAKIDGDADGAASLEETLIFAKDVHSEMAKKHIQDTLGKMDHDKDGELHLDEYRLWHVEFETDQATWEVETAKFKAADSNDNGVLSHEELPGFLHPETNDAVLAVIALANLKHKDFDGDGQLMREEFRLLSLAELKAAAAQGVPVTIAGDHRASSASVEAEFESHDLDGSGLLDLEELKRWEAGHMRAGQLGHEEREVHAEEAMRGLFRVADKDGDGRVTVGEMMAARTEIDDDAHYHLMEWALHHEL